MVLVVVVDNINRKFIMKNQYGYISPFIESKCPECGGKLISSTYTDVCYDCGYGQKYPIQTNDGED